MAAASPEVAAIQAAVFQALPWPRCPTNVGMSALGLLRSRPSPVRQLGRSTPPFGDAPSSTQPCGTRPHGPRLRAYGPSSRRPRRLTDPRL